MGHVLLRFRVHKGFCSLTYNTYSCCCCRSQLRAFGTHVRLRVSVDVEVSPGAL